VLQILPLPIFPMLRLHRGSYLTPKLRCDVRGIVLAFMQDKTKLLVDQYNIG
jgi:hypothetical protein